MKERKIITMYETTITTLTESVLTTVKQLLRKEAFDKTFRARITAPPENGSCRIEYQGAVYPARCSAPLKAGDYAYVCAPQNNWSELFVIST